MTKKLLDKTGTGPHDYAPAFDSLEPSLQSPCRTTRLMSANHRPCRRHYYEAITNNYPDSDRTISLLRCTQRRMVDELEYSFGTCQKLLTLPEVSGSQLR